MGIGSYFGFGGRSSASSVPKFNKYKQIGGSEGQKVLRKMSYDDRKKLQAAIKNIGSNRKSIQSISDSIKKEHGYNMKNKFLKAVEQHYGGGLTIDQKYRNVKASRRIFDSGVGATSINQQKAKGQMGNIGIEKKYGISAKSKGNFSSKSDSPSQGSNPLKF